MKFKVLPLLFAVVLFAQALVLPAYAAKDVSAKSAVLLEMESGEVVYEKDADCRRKMASTTKIMTACVVIDAVPDLQTQVAVDARAVGVEGSSVYLKAGEKMSVEDLLYALMLSSANDAAAALAYAVSGSIETFAARMNDLATSWGLCNTHFTNPHGLDAEEHYTTAKELAIITRHALQNETFCRIVSTKKHICKNDDGTLTRVFVNHNRLLRSYDGAVGVKTGFTKKSGRCLVSAAKKDGVTLIAVTLNAPDDWADHAELLDYGFAQYEHKVLLKENEVQFDLPVTAGQAQTVRLSNTDAVSATVKQSAHKIEYKIEAEQFAFAPVAKGDILGKAKVLVDGVCVGEVPLYAQDDVAKTAEVPKHRWFYRLFKKD